MNDDIINEIIGCQLKVVSIRYKEFVGKWFEDVSRMIENRSIKRVYKVEVQDENRRSSQEVCK